MDNSTDFFSWGKASELAQFHGQAMCRKGWNGKGQFFYYVPPNSYPAQTDIAKAAFPDGIVPYRGYFALKDAQGLVGPWVPSSSDLLADDWCRVDVNPLVNAAIPQNQPVPTSNLDALMDAGRLLYGYWWKPAEKAEDTQIPVLRDAGDTYNRFIETAEKLGGFNLSANAALKCRTVGEILELIH